jgi:hypothetical protein
MEKLKKFMAGAARTAAVDVLRGYVTKRIRALNVDDIIDAIEKDDTDLIGKLSDKERRILATVSRRFGEYIDLITVKNVMTWMIEDAPFHAGVIYGHPKGLKWLAKILEQIRSEALKYAKTPPAEGETELELEPVTEDKGATKT